MFSSRKTDQIRIAPQEDGDVQQLSFTSPVEARVSRSVTPQAKALIGRQVRINGDIEFEGELIIEGLVNGDVTSDDPNALLTVQNGASIDGNVRISTIHLNGTVTGAIESDGLLNISATGAVSGPVRYNNIVLEMGAVINGSLEQVYSEATPFAVEPAQEVHEV